LVALILTLVAACGGGSSEPACQTASDAAPSSPSPETSLTIKIGSYQGKGSPQCIKEIGFQPVMVVIKGDTGKFTVWRSSSMKGDSTADLAIGHANFKDAITSLDSGAFSLGNDPSVNANGVTYHYVAFADSPDISVGSYEGDGTDRHAITGIGFEPALVFVKIDGLGSAPWRSTAHPEGVSVGFHAAGESTNLIRAFTRDGFEVGSDLFVNLGGTYHYVAFREAPGLLATGSYEGDGSDDRDITGIGFQPDWVWVKADSNESKAVHRTSSLSGDFTFQFGELPNFADEIQALLPDGFQVGTDPTVNTDSTTYYYVAFKARSGR
jgi:hypothetical protein